MEAQRQEAELEKHRADALLTACHLGLADDVAALIAAGATTNVRDKRGMRPLFFAAAGGHADVVALLCDHGVDPNDDDALGRTALHFAAMHDRAETCAVLCAREGCWIDAPDHADDTPLLLAARMAGPDTVATLLHHGADVRAKNKLGLNPTCEAVVVRERFDVAEAILSFAGPKAEPLERQRVGPERARLTLADAARAAGKRDAEAWLGARGADVVTGAEDPLSVNDEGGKSGSLSGSIARDSAASEKKKKKPGPGVAPGALDVSLSTARAWSEVPLERRDAEGVPIASRDHLDAYLERRRAFELRAFLAKLVEDDEFQEDFAESAVRDAVAAVAKDFHAVERYRGDARVMRTLEKFRHVQRFCKERGEKIAFADVAAPTEARRIERRNEIARLREEAEEALRRAAEAAGKGYVKAAEEEEGSEGEGRVGGGGSNPGGSSVAGSNSTEREDGSGWSWGSVAREVGRQIATQFVVAAVCFFLTVYVFGFPNPFERKRARGRLRDGEGEL